MATGGWMTLVIVVLSAAFVDGLESQPSSRKIAGLIEQLGAEDFFLREAAHKELEALCEPAFGALRQAAASSEDAEIRSRANAILEVAGLPDPKLAQVIQPQPADHDFLRSIKGKSRKEVLRHFGHPHQAEWHPENTEHWSYYRADGKLYWIFFRLGVATLGMGTEGLQIGGQEFVF